MKTLIESVAADMTGIDVRYGDGYSFNRYVDDQSDITNTALFWHVTSIETDNNGKYLRSNKWKIQFLMLKKTAELLDESYNTDRWTTFEAVKASFNEFVDRLRIKVKESSLKDGDIPPYDVVPIVNYYDVNMDGLSCLLTVDFYEQAYCPA